MCCEEDDLEGKMEVRTRRTVSMGGGERERERELKGDRPN